MLCPPTKVFLQNACVYVCVCGSEGSGLELHPATSSRQDYWHRIPPAPGRNSKDPRAIHQNMGTSVGLASVQMCVVCECVCVCVSVYLHGYQLSLNGAGLLSGALAPSSGKNMSSLLFLSHTQTPVLPIWLFSHCSCFWENVMYMRLYTVYEGTLLYEMCTGTYIMRSLCRDKNIWHSTLLLSSFSHTDTVSNPLNPGSFNLTWNPFCVAQNAHFWLK